MPQDIRVLQCFDCQIFQADIVKKSNKWKCRLCGVQQTVRKEIFRGTGSECRTKTQELNMQKGHQQNKDFNYFVKHLNGEENNETSSCSIMASDLPDCDEEEIISSNNDKAQEKVVEDNPNDAKMSTQRTTLFNFGNSQKWSKDLLERKSVKLSTVEHNDGSAKKKSKWDAYV